MPDIEIVEVGPRDGLQNEAVLFSTAQKLELITLAIDAGVRRIEVASFVNPKLVPQMADAEAVSRGTDPPRRCDLYRFGAEQARRAARDRGGIAGTGCRVRGLGWICSAQSRLKAPMSPWRCASRWCVWRAKKGAVHRSPSPPHSAVPSTAKWIRSVSSTWPRSRPPRGLSKWRLPIPLASRRRATLRIWWRASARRSHRCRCACIFITREIPVLPMCGPP